MEGSSAFKSVFPVGTIKDVTSASVWSVT